MFEGEKTIIFWIGLIILGLASIGLFSIVWFNAIDFYTPPIELQVPFIVGTVVFILIGLYMMKSGKILRGILGLPSEPLPSSHTRAKAKKSSDLLLTGSVLAIIAAGCSLIGGILSAEQWFGYSGYIYAQSSTLAHFALLGVLGIIAFVSGLCAGILALKRQRFGLTVATLSMMISYSVVSFCLAWAYSPYRGTADAFMFYGRFIGAPVFILSLLGGIFIITKRKEFAFPEIEQGSRENL